MAKQAVIMLWCDPHLNNDDQEHVEGFTQIVGGEFGGPTEVWEIELCKEHADAPFTQVQQWAAEYGRDHRPGASTPGRTPGGTPVRVKPPKSTSVYKKARGSERLCCPYCIETRTTPGRVDRHIRKDHPGEPLGSGV
jgi:hypothetical protein